SDWRGRCSTMRQSRPRRAHSLARKRPTGPAPTMSTSIVDVEWLFMTSCTSPRRCDGFAPRRYLRRRPTSSPYRSTGRSQAARARRGKALIRRWRNAPLVRDTRRGANRASTSTAAIPLPQEDSVKKLLLAGLLATLGLAPALASAQTQVPQPRAPQPQAEEKMLVGEVQSIDESGTQITLKDGTMLLTPPGSMLRPGALEQGMVVVAMYRE